MDSRNTVAGPTNNGARSSVRDRANPEPLGVPPLRAWAMLGISNSTGYELLAAGELASYTVGRARRITLSSIHDYVARHSTPALSALPRPRGRPSKVFASS